MNANPPKTAMERFEAERQLHRVPYVNTFNALSVEQQLMMFVLAIADAYPENAPRDRFGRIQGPRNLNKLRHLAIVLDTAGALDVQDQAGNVARALAHHLRDVARPPVD